MTSAGSTLILRADANPDIGTGHVMRCLALAEAWKRAGGSTVFVSEIHSESLRQVVGERSHLIEIDPAKEWTSVSKALDQNAGAPVVLDGYRFDESYQQKIGDAGHKLLVIDDSVRLPHYCADVLLNQNIGAEGLNYSAQPYTRFLLGTRYALLRPEFVARTEWTRQDFSGRRVLVTMGGADADNVTQTVVEGLSGLENIEARIIVGPENPHEGSLRKAISERPSFHLLHFARNMAEQMEWADVAVTAAGSTCWELLLMMVPSVLIVLADNQEPIARGLAQRGAAISLGCAKGVAAADVTRCFRELLADVSRRREMALRGRELVDGRGADRVVRAVRES